MQFRHFWRQISSAYNDLKNVSTEGLLLKQVQGRLVNYLSRSLMEDTTYGGFTQASSHIDCSDRKVLLLPVADGPNKRGAKVE